ncbi:hypothetical protein FNJ84_19915 [Paracoccus sp. M683]|nr:pectinesterase family protein [Paracoccus sp. M683]TRW94188.1 hypothetical protein FNJ84_19915 [Paracoccus sp. M683]
MRPELTEAQAAAFTRDQVLGHTGKAGDDRADPWSPGRMIAGALTPDLVVGQGGHASVQQAVNAAIALGRTGRVFIGIAPGTYRGLVYLPRLPFALTLFGLGTVPADVQLVENIDAEMPGEEYRQRFEGQFATSPAPVTTVFDRIARMEKITTAHASVLRVEGDDTQLLNLAIRNSYNADRDQPESTVKNAQGQYRKGQHQAVALLVAGADRVQLQDVALSSFQDTLYLQSPRKGVTVRTCLTGCEIEGDVDFIFGQSTAWFENCVIRSRGTRAPQAWAVAPSTDLRTRYGFVFSGCDFTHDGSAAALAGGFRLGRQWFEGVRATPYGRSPLPGYRCDLGEVSAYVPPRGTISRATLQSVGKCVILNSRIGAHIDRNMPWDSWTGPDWNPRYRPAQYVAGDMLRELSDWLAQQALNLADIEPEMIFLAEFRNDHRAAASSPGGSQDASARFNGAKPPG